MEMFRGGESLYRENLAAIHLAHEHQAGVHRLAVHDHGARAAVAYVTPQLRAGQVELVAQQPQQRRFWRDGSAARLAVQFKRYVYHWIPPVASPGPAPMRLRALVS